jgi:hypothetical protein
MYHTDTILTRCDIVDVIKWMNVLSPEPEGKWRAM